MAAAVHRMITTDPEQGTGDCAACGPVPLAWRTDASGKRTPRCGPARTAQRDSAGRHGGTRTPRKRADPAKRRREHGLTAAEARAFVQGKSCAICGRSGLPLFVDHCHKTGRVRDALCTRCNTGLGQFVDDPVLLLTALTYVQQHAAAAVSGAVARPGPPVGCSS